MLWYVMLGSAVGGGVRFLLGSWIQGRLGAGFPVGTLIINVTGSFLLALIFGYGAESAAIRPEIRALLATGFCGGYTTFSTFTYETMRLIEDGDWHRAAWYAVLSASFSLTAAFLGLAAGKEILALRRSL